MEYIIDNGTVIGIIDHYKNFKKGLSFYGTNKDSIQIGKFRYDKDQVLRAHKHIERKREINKTQEILIVFEGSCILYIYGVNDNIIQEKILKEGNFYISYNGGVKYKILEDDTFLLEVKSGDYIVTSDDEDRVLINESVPTPSIQNKIS